ncbi:MAG TPA: hypothetical protein VG937_35450 [Polyangiaceae bacterium]|jgi:hypothetical protein|nr:hypothetical protein [Polyangiaceae bacterium]
MLRKSFGWVSVLAALSGCQNDHPEGELVLARQDPLQSVYVAWSESTTFKGVHLVTSWANGKKAKSVGVIRPAGENWPNATEGLREGTCGTTFISKHKAVTAAHCVDSGNLPNVWPNQTSPFRVQQINTSSLNLTEAMDQTRITGTWPAYTRADPLTAAEGYNPVTTTCFVEVRCDSATGHGRNNCPASFGANVVDIALIHCPQRAATDFVKVAASDSGTGPVEVWWFHELVNLNTGTAQPYQPVGNEAHYHNYTATAAGRSENYHYRNDTQEHQVLPLVSWRNVNNVQYRATGKGTTYTTNNVPVCHGTSGSGFFAAPVAGNWNDADPRLLGPAIHGDTFLNTHLCENMNSTTASSDYVNVEYTQKIEALVLGDR